jgi:hypothetical protein
VEKDGGGHALAEQFTQIGSAYDGLNNSLKAARRAEREAKKTKLGPWLEIGESPEAVQTQIDDLRSQLTDATKGKVNLDKMKRDMDATVSKAVAAKDEEISKMRQSLNKYLITSGATAALAKKAPDAVKLLLPHVISQAHVFQEGDDYVPRIVDSAGDPRSDGKGGFMDFDALVSEMERSPEYGTAFPSARKSGAGMGGTGGDSARPNPGSNSGPNTPMDMIREGLRQRGIS